MSTISESEKQQALQRAREHIFSTALPDAAADLCLANMTFGLAKIHYAQQHYGLPADATFVGTPDMTITRNSGRWRAGIGYGGRLSWGDGDRDMLVLDVKPNTCGMLVGGLRDQPDPRALTERLHHLHRSNLVVDGVPIKWDFGTGNHFIDVFEMAPGVSAPALPPYAFVLHASGAELRGQSEHGPGLYWDESPHWQARCEQLDTPWGPLHVLRGKAIQQYMDVYWQTEDFAIRRRDLAGRSLFGDYEPIANINHQGMTNPNEVLLGCQRTDGPQPQLLPILVRADRPAYLMHGLPNLSPDQIDRLGFRSAAEKWGVLGRLDGANVIPHGAGYSLPHLSRVRRVMQIDGARYYELERVGRQDTQIISEPKDLTCGYRDEAVVHRSVECGLGVIAAQLDPLFVLKT